MKKRPRTFLGEFLRAGIKPGTFFVFLALMMSFSALALAISASSHERNSDFLLANALFQSGRHEGALDLAKKAVDSAPSAVAFDLLGSIYLNEGELEKAREVFSRGIEAYPNDASLHNGLGVSYARLGDFRTAESEYRRAVAIDPEHPNAQTNLDYILNEKQ